MVLISEDEWLSAHYPNEINSFDDYLAHSARISGDGTVIVGSSYSNWTDEKAFIWTEGSGMISLMDWLITKSVDISGFTQLLSAEGISGDGNAIVGYGINLAGQREAFYVQITPVPEPESYAMLTAGLVFIRLIQRRKEAVV